MVRKLLPGIAALLRRLARGADRLSGPLVVLALVLLIALFGREILGLVRNWAAVDEQLAHRDKVLDGARGGLDILAFPIAVDAHTEVFDAFVSADQEVVYQHRLFKLDHIEISEIFGPDFEALTMIPTITKLCADNSSRLLFSNGIPIRYQYFDRDDHYVGGFVIEDCEGNHRVAERGGPVQGESASR
jgi:hypothetical protein